MKDFSRISLNDACVRNLRLYPSSVEVDYVDWQEKFHTLVFNNAISCFAVKVHGTELSHGEVEHDGEYLRGCCEIAEEDSHQQFHVFNFVDAWHERKILRIVAADVRWKPYEGKLTFDSLG